MNTGQEEDIVALVDALESSGDSFGATVTEILSVLKTLPRQSTDEKTRDLVRKLTTALCNAAQTEERCKTMLSNKDTLQLLSEFSNSDNLGARMSCFMAFRNLSVPSWAKLPLAQNAAVVAALKSGLKDEGGAINSSALSALRALVTNCPSEVIEILDASEFMEPLVMHAVTKRLVRHPDGRTFWPQIEACRTLVHCSKVPQIAAVMERLGAAKALSEFAIDATHATLQTEASEGLLNIVRCNPAHVFERFGPIVVKAAVALYYIPNNNAALSNAAEILALFNAASSSCKNQLAEMASKDEKLKDILKRL